MNTLSKMSYVAANSKSWARNDSTKREGAVKQIGNSFQRALQVLLLGLVTSFMATVQASDTITYYHLDALGSPVAASSETGQEVWRENYFPYGARIEKQASAANQTRWYTGHPHDDDTGLTYMGARFYDPVVGRFMAVDPVKFHEGNIQSFNRYAYANNNPYKYVDPDGESPAHLQRLWEIGRNLITAARSGSLFKGRGPRNSASAKETRQAADVPSVPGGSRIHPGRQGKHQVGHNNYIQGRSELTHKSPQSLVNRYAGKGQPANKVPKGQPGYRERVNFGEKIGNYRDPMTGKSSPTKTGIIHHSKDGVHIIPARPIP